MAFSKIYPDVNALDTFSLVKLMSDPNKALEYWAKYEDARAVYEAQKAELSAAWAELKENQKAFLDQLGAFAKDTEDFARAKAQWEAQVKQDKLANDQLQKKLSTWEKELSLTSAGHSDAYKEINRQRAKLEQDEDALKEEKQRFTNYAALQDKSLAAREAAVAAREVKAKQLADLVKDL